MRKNKINQIVLLIGLTIVVPVLLIGQTKEALNKEGNLYFDRALNYFPEHLDSCFNAIEYSMGCFKKAENWKQYVDCRNALGNLSNLKGEYTVALEHMFLAIEESKMYLDEISKGRSDALCNYGTFLSYLGNERKAIKYLEESYELEDQMEEDTSKISTISNIGGVYSRMGDYEEALKCFYHVLDLHNTPRYHFNPINIALTYAKMGRVYYRTEQLDSAKMYYRKSLDIMNNSERILAADVGFHIKVESDLGMARVFLKEKNEKKVAFHVNEARGLSNSKNFNQGGSAYQILGELAIENNDFPKAIDYFLKSKKETIEKYQEFEKHAEVAKKNILLAETYVRMEAFSKAVKHFHQGIQMLSFNELEDDVYQTPQLDDIYSRVHFLKALNGKANTFFKAYQKNKEQKYLIAAYEHFEVVADLIQDIRKDYEQEGSLLQLSTQVLPMYEEAINVALELNKQTGDEKYLHQAFVFSESNRAILLLESINENIAMGFSEIPELLLEEESDLKFEIAFYKRRINEELSKGATRDKQLLIEFNKTIFDLEQNHKKMIATFEKDYPKYYELKYDTKLANVKKIQDKIGNSNATLIEYFFGEENIFVFSISRSKVEIQELKRSDQLLNPVQKIRDFVSTPPGYNSEKRFSDYVANARYVYQELLKPSIHSETSHLIIVADEILSYLPFEVLLTAPPETEKSLYSLNNLSYLIEDYEVSYSYSASLFLNESLSQKTPAKYRFLGIAPSFGNTKEIAQRFCTEGQLNGLTCNQSEVESVQNLLGGDILLGEAANKNFFEAQAGDCQILHLATHACLDDENPAFSKIYLSDDYISNSDLYSLQLKSELTVLSACETGGGRLAKGEGVMSLARGFFHAGCPSVVMSLWPVDDCATSDIMLEFYKSICDGANKSTSIQEAKLNYLSTAKKAQQHPYYWAAFVQVGDFKPLSFTGQGINSMIWYILAPIILLFGYFFFRKNNRST